ncbi:hypothetical protein WJX73_008628 [Symbiochloris irregularis]|uniref:OTU domain-containing protein n=1 Tax=Symbiochloris irregularis TaxID=706552 RepID=A0AAW1PN91_9CHLO
MGNKGGGRKGFVKAAAATKQSGPEDDDYAAETNAAPPSSSQTGSEVPEAATSSALPQRRSPESKPGGPPESCVASLASGEPETRGQMQQRHKKEVKLQKDVTKKLGKKHKDAAAHLEAQLEARHASELAALQSDASQDTDSNSFAMADSLYAVHVEGNEPKQAPSKAQKRREKAAAADAARDARIAAELEAAGDSERVLEEQALEDLLLPLGLCVRSIPSDGHCLYRAVEDQLRELRHGAAAWMRQHPLDFAPFVTEEEQAEADGALGDAVNGDTSAFDRYCRSVEDTAVWGGEAEITALAGHLRRQITVYAAGMPLMEFIPPVQKGDSSQEDHAELEDWEKFAFNI